MCARRATSRLVGVCFAFAVAAAGCGGDGFAEEDGDNPPLGPEDMRDPVFEGDEGPLLEAPGGAFVDTECGDKHRRHGIDSFTYKGARFTKSGSVETYDHLDFSCNRVEIDTNTHYKSGRHTFEGDVKIVRVSAKTSVVQIFKGGSGPVLMIRGNSSSGGVLRSPGGGPTYASGIMNKWVSLRIVHDLPGDSLTVDVDGRRAYSSNAKKGGGGGFNVKYGNYGTGAPTTVQWRNVSWD